MREPATAPDEPLDDAAIDELDRILLERVDEDAWQEGMDEGIVEVSGLDGFFTALVSGPVTILPSQWLPAVWGDFEPEWQEPAEFERVFTLMTRHMNSIVTHLMTEPDSFEPLFRESLSDGVAVTVVDEWCEGYRRGVELADAAWQDGGDAVLELLEPIFAFTEADDWPAYELTFDETVRLQQTIASSARALHAFWLARRGGRASSTGPVQAAEPRVGRNDPCPCGSGRKYKKCCLH